MRKSKSILATSTINVPFKYRGKCYIAVPDIAGLNNCPFCVFKYTVTCNSNYCSYYGRKDESLVHFKQVDNEKK